MKRPPTHPFSPMREETAMEQEGGAKSTGCLTAWVDTRTACGGLKPVSVRRTLLYYVIVYG